MPEDRAGALGLDVYGTLVDPLSMNERLRPFAGDEADRMAALWRNKQLEYAFRRALMREYEDFDVCTRQALDHAAQASGVALSMEDKEQLIEEYQSLEPFPDVIPGVEAIKEAGRTVVAFSNGVEGTVRTLLGRAGILPLFDGVVSVDDVKSFKPDPEVYRHLTRLLEKGPEETWVVSSNPFDVVGAQSAGLRAAWVRRDPNAVFDPWGTEPDLVASDLVDLAGKL